MRKIAIALGAFVVLVIAAAIIVPFLIPADAYVARITEAVKQATGRDLKIAGPVSFHLLPDIALSASNVSLSGPGGGVDFATIEKLDVGLKLMPLLSHKVEIDHLTLNQPVIHLAVDKTGQNNWSFQKEGAAPTKAPAKPEPEKAGSAQSQLQQLSLGTIRISDGTLTYDDARGGKHQSVSKLDASFSLPSLAGKLSLKANADWNGKTVTINLAIDNLEDAIKGKESAMTASIDAPSLKLHLDGKAVSGTPIGFTGAIDASSPSLRDLAAWAGSPLKASGNSFGAFSLKGDLVSNGKMISLSKASLSLDALKASGSIAIDMEGAKPRIKGQLDLGDVDLNPYLAPAGSAPADAAPPGAPTTAGTGWSEAPIDASALRGADAEISLSLTSLKFHTIAIGRTVLTLALSNGRGDISFKQLTLYGGSGTGDVKLDGANPGVGFALSLALANVQMQPLLQAAMGVDRFSGTGMVNLALTGAGRSQAQLMGTLGGKAALRIANGAIKGIDLVAIEHKPLQGLTANSSTAETAFTALTGSFTIASGVASNQDLVLDAPSLGLTGKGTIDLYHRTINYRVEPSLPGGIQGGKTGIYGTAVPIVISGPWSSVSYAPDVSAVVQQKAQQAITKELGKLGGGSGNSKAGGLLKGLLGH